MVSLEAVIGLLSARVRLKDRELDFLLNCHLLFFTDTSVKCSLSNEFIFSQI